MTTEVQTKPKINLFKQIVTSTNERRDLKGWYSQELGHLYLIRIDHISGKSEILKDCFIKIGISSQKDVFSRFNLLPQCYRVTLIQDLILPLAEVKRLEKALHNHFKPYSYTTKHKRWGGKTEAFKLSLLELFSNLDEMIEGLPVRAEQPARAITQQL